MFIRRLMTKPIAVIIACQNSDEAERISEVLLKRKLAACCNIFPNLNSVFLWPPGKGRFDYADESMVLVKTLDSKWTDLEKAVLTVHSYDNPEIIAIPLSHVTKKYLSWMEKELT